jgi:transcriptional regulator with XRE-family HTH domain
MTIAIDTKWFVNRIADRDMSQRGLASLMNLDPAAISLMLRGKRKMTMAEAAQMAALLDVAPSEIFERAGIEAANPKQVKMIGFVDGKGEIVFAAKGAHTFVAPPGEVAPATVAIQAKTAGTALDHLDGFIYFVDDCKGNPTQYLNSYVLCAIKGGATMLALVRKGYQRGTYNLRPLGGNTNLENMQIVWASPVTFIKLPL